MASRRTGSPDRHAFLTALATRVEEPLLTAGYKQVRLREGRPHLRLWLPMDHPLAGRTSYISLRAKGGELAFRHIIRTGSLDDSWRIVERLRQAYAERLAEALPDEAQVIWHTADDRANAANDQVRIVHTGGGYDDLDPDDAAQWVLAVCRVWLELLSDGLPDEIRTLAGG